MPGKSGNPGGRPKGIEALARAHTPAAIERLVRALDDDDSRVAVTAAGMLLDRGWGKPAQTVADATTGQPVTFLHLVAARAFNEQQRVIDADVPRDDTSVDTTQSGPPPDIMAPATE